MSSRDKMVKAYTKSLFQNLLNVDFSNEIKDFAISTPEKISTAQKNVLNAFIIGEELLLLRALFLNSEKMRIVFRNPIIPETQKMAILRNFFPGMSKITCSFLSILVEKCHLGYIPEISQEFNEILLKYRKIAKVTLYISSPLEETIGLRFLELLKKLTESKEIILSVIYSPKLLAGLILEYNSMSLNASILSSFKII